MNDYNLLVTQEAYEESDDPETGLGIAILDFGDMVSILHCTSLHLRIPLSHCIVKHLACSKHLTPVARCTRVESLTSQSRWHTCAKGKHLGKQHFGLQALLLKVTVLAHLSRLRSAEPSSHP